MTNAANIAQYTATQSSSTQVLSYLIPSFVAGLLLPFGFAPFHFPGLAILGLVLLYRLLQQKTRRQTLMIGLSFGLGFFGLGVSWVCVSIHTYGHLHLLLACGITLLFVGYLALFTGLFALSYHALACPQSTVYNAILFAALWCASEYLRANFLSGFPWLLLGFGQMDTPLKLLLPVIGVYGVGFFACFAAACLALETRSTRAHITKLTSVVALLLSPLALQSIPWGSTSTHPIPISVIQANLSMRDKWDDALFWQLLNTYQSHIEHSIAQGNLIVLPESAIPLPPSYIADYLEHLHEKAKTRDSAILMGVPLPTNPQETNYFNAMITLGAADGTYLKQHLVPFGEYIPKPFQTLMDWLSLPNANMQPGRPHQSLIRVQTYPVATLICYELAYPQLLRAQLPEAAWIVSISDDGWFGHSFAMYQQLQMAQVLSMQTARFQVVANNDGLSSVINTKGEITASLPAFRAGVLQAEIQPTTGQTPWVILGDSPALFLCALIILRAFVRSRLVKNPWPFWQRKIEKFR